MGFTDNRDSKKWWQSSLVHGIFGIVLSLVTFAYVPGEQFPEAPYVAAIVMLMAIWWIFEVIPIPVTALIPIVFFPMFDVSDIGSVSTFYGRPIIFLFLGGFILALGLQETGLHKRLALRIVHWIGSQPRQLVLGFMLASGLLSMWISNTAAVMVLVPIALSVLEGIKAEGPDKEMIRKFGVCFMLGIAYAADIGGMATLIGTPPNLIFLEMYTQLFPDKAAIGFLEWMMIGLPLSATFMFIGWYILTHWIFRFPKTELFTGEDTIEEQIRALGPISRDEMASGLIFLSAVILWITGSDIIISDSLTVHGWRSLLGLEYMTDPAVAILAAILLFLVPSYKKDKGPLLSWKRSRDIPWGIILLFGGGFAIAGGFEASGLSVLLEGAFKNIPPMAPLALIIFVAIAVTFITELTSNTAITNLILPILATGAIAMAIDPKLIMIPATLSASCAFMMPIASPTQTIIFGTGYVSIQQMMRAGIWFNILGIILIVAVFAIYIAVF
ncbi:MAG: hypothetical protein DRI69_06750 [Bacteroidetes bacterium]|nr:MAG: hypothetical protein DRI69_06750 [Bacteroidota bacterium]